jgi:fructuronate reductase
MKPIQWLHMGAGNIFRIFLAALAMDLDMDIAVCECFDGEIIPTVFEPYHNETLAVTLHADGSIHKRRLTSIKEAFGFDKDKLTHIITHPGLQMVSLTITEKGYAVSRIAESPEDAVTTLECIVWGLYKRFQADAPALTLVSLDNFAANGDVLKQALLSIAHKWQQNGNVPESFVSYVSSLAYPWTMIDKITPHPSETVATLLKADGFTDIQITKTAKGTVIAPFVNAESSQYLVMEDNFPNGRPDFERLTHAGVYLTDRETVRKVDHMKVCACLNPLHTILGMCGMLLNYPTIAACMNDTRLVSFVRLAAAEALLVVSHPGIINPQDFLEEVLTVRFPNPFIPDTPTRIVTDSSQKIPVRFGKTLTAREKAGLPADELTAIPLLIALWLRYRTGLDDNGEPLTLAPDPLVPKEIAALEGLPFGAAADLQQILINEKQFGVDLYKTGLGEKIETLFKILSYKPGAVGEVLNGFTC